MTVKTVWFIGISFMMLEYKSFVYQMVSKMFQHVRSSHEAAKTINKANGRFVTMKPRTPTVAARFHDSLQHLLESMSK